MTVPAAGSAGSELSAVGPILLFDVGDVTIRTPDVLRDARQTPSRSEAIPLAARAFPDVGDRVSGVFYTSPDAASDLPAPGKYVLESSGSGAGAQSVEHFAIEAEAPAPPAEVTIGGRALAEGLDIAEGEALDVKWRVSSDPASASKDDLAYIEIVAENGVAARCAFEDRGSGRLPASLLRDAGFGRLPLVATLAVHRVRQGTFQVTGLDSGEVRFDISVAAGVTLRGSESRR